MDLPDKVLPIGTGSNNSTSNETGSDDGSRAKLSPAVVSAIVLASAGAALLVVGAVVAKKRSRGDASASSGSALEMEGAASSV